MKIKINKMRKEAKTPQRAHYNDVGADVFAVEDTTIAPGATAKIPLGIGLELPDGLVATIFPRSSLASEGISSEMAPIDPGYRGEIHAILTNHTPHVRYINQGDKIGQLVIQPVIYGEYETELGETRKANGFGSTGK